MDTETSEIIGGGSPVGEISTPEPIGPNGIGGRAGTGIDSDADVDADVDVDAGAAEDDGGPEQGGAGGDSDAGASDATSVEQPAVDAADDTSATVDAGAGAPETAPDTVSNAPDDAAGADLSPAADADGPGADGANAADGNEAPAPGPDSVVPLFSGKHLYYGNETTRRADAAVVFPLMPALYERITLALALSCPAGGCDRVEKRGFLAVVGRTAQGAEVVTEIVRFISPAGVGASWSIDLTDLRPLLSGNVTVRVFVETWVGPGDPGGAGYVVDASVDFRGGRPARRPIAVLPVWNETSFVHGDPNNPGAAAVAPRQVTLPAGASAVELRAIITGHGQGNLEGCGAFCKKSHRFVVGATPFDRVVWRDDCATTGAPGQLGPWMLSRAGWCPGAPTVPWVIDVTSAFVGAATTVSYAIADYVNTCRPNAPVCGGCSMGTSCAYNGGNHTPPTYYVSALLIAYGP